MAQNFADTYHFNYFMIHVRLNRNSARTFVLKGAIAVLVIILVITLVVLLVTARN